MQPERQRAGRLAALFAVMAIGLAIGAVLGTDPAYVGGSAAGVEAPTSSLDPDLRRARRLERACARSLDAVRRAGLIRETWHDRQGGHVAVDTALWRELPHEARVDLIDTLRCDGLFGHSPKAITFHNPSGTPLGTWTRRGGLVYRVSVTH